MSLERTLGQEMIFEMPYHPGSTYKPTPDLLEEAADCVLVLGVATHVGGPELPAHSAAAEAGQVGVGARVTRPGLCRTITSKVVVIRAKAKMQNILPRKSLEKAKQIRPCLTYYTTNQLGTSPTIFGTPKTFREHLKIVSNTENQRGAPKT